MKPPWDDKIYARIAEYALQLNSGNLTADATIAALTRFSCTVVLGADHAAITVVDGDRVTTPAATSTFPVVLDDIQRRHREGPCMSSAVGNRCVVVDDLATDTRWPCYRADAVAMTPVRSVLAVHLFSHGGVRSALNLYADTAHAFTQQSIDTALMFAEHAALAWDTAQRRHQVAHAVSGDLINQAVGMLMQRNSISVDQAFALLAGVAEHTGDNVADIARRIVATATTR